MFSSCKKNELSKYESRYILEQICNVKFNFASIYIKIIIISTWNFFLIFLECFPSIYPVVSATAKLSPIFTSVNPDADVNPLKSARHVCKSYLLLLEITDVPPPSRAKDNKGLGRHGLPKRIFFTENKRKGFKQYVCLRTFFS